MAYTGAKSTVDSHVEVDADTGEKKGVITRKVELRDMEARLNEKGELVNVAGRPFKAPMPEHKWKPYFKPRKRIPGTWGAKRAKLSNADLETLIFGENGKDLDLAFERDDQGEWKDPEAVALGFIDAVAKGVPEGRYAMLIGSNRGELRGLVRDLGLNEVYRAAVKEGYDAIAEDALTIASTPVNVEEVTEAYDKDGNLTGRYVKKGDNVLSRKLAYQARMELLSKWNPEKYGNKVEVKTTGDMATAIAGARKRLSPEVVETLEPLKYLEGHDGE